tara:strand:+ start:385 stop:576 length:192 start_codon:yes stop_codon:yes gene_type:complete
MKLKEQIANWAIEKINNEDTKEKVVAKWNKNLNIPIIGEDTEAKILSAIYDSVVDVLEDVLKK